MSRLSFYTLMPTLFLCFAAARPVAADELLLAFTQWEDGAEPEQRDMRLRYDWQSGKHLSGHFRFTYQPVLLEGGYPPPAHNGHLYEYAVGLRRQWQGVTLELETGAHISSNMFIHGRFHGEALVTTFRLWSGQNEERWQPGLAGDYLFGGFRLYPRLRRSLPAGDTRIDLELPVALRWRAGDGRWSVGLQRHGRKWGVLDREREQASAVYLSEWRLQLTARGNTGWRGMDLEVGLGWSLDRTLRYSNTAGLRRRIEPGDAAFFSLALHVPL